MSNFVRYCLGNRLCFRHKLWNSIIKQLSSIMYMYLVAKTWRWVRLGDEAMRIPSSAHIPRSLSGDTEPIPARNVTITPHLMLTH